MKPENPPAFPKHTQSLAKSDGIESWVETLPGSEGMSLRDYFAAKAMQSVILAAMTNDDTARKLNGEGGPAGELVSKIAYHLADAMLTERSKP
jgi:hypothetical protein